MAITKDRKTEIIDQFRREPTDTGSPEVQIALLTLPVLEEPEPRPWRNPTAPASCRRRPFAHAGGRGDWAWTAVSAAAGAGALRSTSHLMTK